MEPGIYTMSNEDYHRGKGKDALSKGGLDKLDKSPAHLKIHFEEESKPTPAMIFGSNFHCAALEPEIFKRDYMVEPDFGDKRKKENKAAHVIFQLEVEEKGLTIISQSDMDLINYMVDSLYESDVVSGLLSDGIAEQSFFWNHPKWGFGCKVRPDYLNDKYRIAIDLKSAADASPEAFGKATANYKYHWQGSWYLDGINELSPEKYEEFVFIVVEKTPPYAVQNYILKRDDIYLAELQIEPLLSQYAECLASDVWPGPSDRIQTLTLPAWYIRNALN